jgi:hypothetical protein
MKRTLLLFSLLTFSFSGICQSLVSTNPENKKAILEEFTGVNCGFCPDGHAIANSIKANNPDDFFVINIHQGGFAVPGAGQPDFRTPFGDAIVAQSYLGSGFGYPSGTVNRQNFPGREMTNAGTTAMGRGSWAASVSDVLTESSYVNVGVEAQIDVNTRVLTVNVEAYYTGNSPETTNKINIALLQNNTLGPQASGGMGNNYNHMHRLIHMVTGQWGDDITTTTQGSLFSQTYTYTIPNDYNGIPADLYTAEMEVVAFVTETTQKIINGNGAYATYTGLSNNNDASLKSVQDFSEICDSSISPTIEIQNLGNNTINNLAIQYSVNGGTPQTYNWTGSLGSLFSEEINLPDIQFNLQQVNQLDVSIPSDDDTSNNTETKTINTADIFITPSVSLSLTLDNYPEETIWGVLDSAGNVVQQGGPYNGQAGQTITATINLPQDDCYEFLILDSYGDGICCAYGNGSYTLTAQNGDVIATGGQFASEDSKIFSNYNTLSSNSFEITEFNIFPNPSTGIVNINVNEPFEYKIYNLQGKLMANGISNTSSEELDLRELSSGLYLLNITIGSSSRTQKLILK